MREAWLVLLAIAGCGDNSPNPVDAGGFDAPTGLVTVRYAPRDGSSGGGAQVYFQNHDSSLILGTRTFEDGTANAFMPNGGFVTVRTAAYDLWTWAGVKPGDNLVLGEPRPIERDHPLFLHVTADPDANTYWLHTSCGDNVEVTGAHTQPRPVTIRDCDTGPVDLLLLTRKVNFSTLSHYTYRRDVVLGGSLALDEPLQPVLPSLIELTSVPSRFGYFYARQELRGRTGGTLFDSGTFGTALIDGQQGGTGTVPIPRPPEATLVSYVDDVNTNGTSSLLHLVHWAPAGAPVEIAVDQYLLRSFVGEPMFERDSNTLLWGEANDGMLGEAAVADLVFSRTALRWHIIAPRAPELIGMGSLKLPVLPDPELQLQPNETVRTIGLWSIRGTGGYDGFRATLLGWNPGERWPIVGAEGHAQWSELATDRL